MRRALIGIAAAALAGCATKPEPAPPAAPAAAPAEPRAAAPAVPPPAVENWPDRPLSPGDWTYSGNGSGSEARYAGFGLRCDRGQGRIVLFREGASGPLRMRTSYGERSLSSGTALAAGDPLLDEIAFSRGRFAVETQSGEALIVPAWPEPARVIEDCRG